MFRVILVFLIAFSTLFVSDLFAQKEVWYAKGQKAFHEKKFKDAIESMNRVLDHDSKNFDAYYLRGQSYLFEQNLDMALKDFNKCIELKPKSADSYNYRGLTYSYSSMLEEAIRDFTSAISIDAKFTEAYLNRGSAYVTAKEHDKALQDLNTANKLNPENPAIYYQRARLYYTMSYYEKSISDFGAAIKKGLKSAKVYYSRGNAYFKNGEYRLAIKDYTKAIGFDPKDSEALNNRALAYDKIGDKKKALKDRETLNKIAGRIFTPVNKIKFSDFSSSDGKFSIQLPKEWHKIASNNADVVEMVVSQEKIESIYQPYMAGVRMSMNCNMSKSYPGIKTTQDAIEFWNSSVRKNGESYFDYQIYSKKSIKRGSWTGWLQKVRIHIQKEAIPLRLYEVVLAKDDDLFFAYFQAPEVEFSYFQTIFDKSFETLKIKQ